MKKVLLMKAALLSLKNVFSLFLFLVMMSAAFDANAQALIPAAEGGFENGSTFAANNWIEVQTTASPRKWQIGSAATANTGTNAAYTGSTTNNNGSNVTQVSHIYRDVVIPTLTSGQTVNLTFAIRMPTIESGFDYLDVYRTTTARVPVGNTIPGTGFTLLYSNTNTAIPNWTQVAPIDLTAQAGTTVRLVFTFENDFDSTAPNANPAIDDVKVTVVTPAPTITTTAASYGPFCSTASNNIVVNYSKTGTLTGTYRVQASNANGAFPANATTGLLTTISEGTNTITVAIPVGVNPGNYRVRVINTSPETISATNNGSNIVINDPPSATGVTICQGASGVLTATAIAPINLAGTIGTTPTVVRPNTSTNSATCGFSTIQRGYSINTFQVTVNGTYTFTMASTSNYDGMAYLGGGAYVPGSCTGFIKGDDDSNANEPSFTAALTTGVVYTLVSTTYDGGTGTYSYTVTPPTNGQIVAPVQWYAAATGGTVIGTGSSFNPVGASGSGLANSNTPGTTTFYAANSSAATCRTPANFVINPNINAGVTIAANPAGAICAGTSVTFTATPVNGGTTPTYIWKKGGVAISGATGATYTTSTLANGDSITVTMTSNATPCLVGSPATSAPIVVTVNPIVNPTFTQVAPICSGAALSPLPTTSTNGITGTWSPAINNTQTTAYTFTPTAGQCANTASMTVVVNPIVNPTFTQVAPICSGAALSPLPTTSTNGITGTWSPAINNTQTTTYTFTPTAGQCANTALMTITVISNPVGGTISGGSTVCASSNAGTLTLSGYSGTIVKWQSATAPDFSDAIDIANTTTSQSYSNISNTTYYRAVISNGSCGPVNSASAIIALGNVTTWDGTSWDNGEPLSTSTIIFIGNYTSPASLSGCTATVTNNSSVTLSTGNDLTLNGSLTVASGSSFIVSNNANLLQTSDAANSGNVIVKRNSSAIMRQDYTLWSSPVTGQNLLAFSPQTLVTPTSRFYSYNTNTNIYNSIVTPSAVTFGLAKGYLIRVRNTHPETTPTIWTGNFTGVPNNGTINYAMENFGAAKRFNLIGNPYPSTIDAIKFVNDNISNITGTLYFWRKTNNALMPSYSSWSKAGYNPNDPQSVRGTFVTSYPALADPQGVIQTGQGFFVEALGNAATVQFNNSQRISDHANQFFRNAAVTAAADSDYESHRLWLNVTNAAGGFCQTAVGYFTDATLAFDNGADSKAINDGPIELYSKADDAKLVIQARPVPFVATDVVPMGFKAATAGNFTIAIDHVDGLFSGSQNIYLKDNLTGAAQDLKAAGYTFTSEAGTFDSRFEIIYQSQTLGVSGPVLENAVVIYKQGGHFVINSGSLVMSNVKVFDIRGRLLIDKSDISASETTIDAGEVNQVLVVKITSNANQTVTRKVVN